MARIPQQARRARRQSILIICEGSKTEPNYLGALIRELKLTSIQIPRDHDTDPLNLARKAIRALKDDAHLASAYVVFDKDEHVNFAAAVGLIQNHPLHDQRLFMIRSQPSFELWLLLHTERCRAPLSREQALERLKAAVPEYDKGKVACMDYFIDRIDIALDNADFAWLDAVETGEFNPSTEMHKLVRRLQAISA